MSGIPSAPRLAALLARNLGCSRREAGALVAAGRVRDAGGARFADPATRVAAADLPLSCHCDGRPILLHDTFHLVLDKPAGCVTALRDALHPTAYALVREAPLHAELRPVGRLDRDATGLLVFTTDGAWLHRLVHPRQALPRTYQVALARPHAPLPPSLRLGDGHRPRVARLVALDREALHPSLPRASGAVAFAEITVLEGTYHEVRRIFAALGSHVLSLCRVGFGRLALPRDLAPGAWRALDPADVA